MVDFTTQRQHKTRQSSLLVDGTLPPGIHVFELVVADASGNQSTAAQVKVEVVRSPIPVTPVTPVIPVNPVTPLGTVTPTPPIIRRRRPRNP